MKNWKYMAATAALSAFGAGSALAQQGWSTECLDLTATASPYSDDYGILSVGNDLFQASLGVSGNVNWGGTNGPCFAGRQMDASGRFAFSVGPTGSVQSSFDDGLAVTTGAPTDPVGDFCYARIFKNDNNGGGSALFGDGGLSVAFVGASNRYIQAIWSDGDVSVNLRMRSIGDAIRMSWDITNITEEAMQLGLGFGAYAGMRTSNGAVDSQPNFNGTFPNQANSGLGTNTGNPKRTSDNFVGFTNVPTTRPIRNERRFASSSPNFPAYVDFMFGQTEAYGMRIQNEADDSVKDASQADVITIGNFFGPVQGQLINNNMRFNVAGDPTGVAEEADILLSDVAFAQRYPIENVAPGGTRSIVHYIRSTWSVASYLDPYSVVLDAPRTVSSVNSGQDGLSPNPMTIRVYLDNQYAQLDREIALSDMRFTLNLPPGLSLVPGESQVRTINTLAPNAIGFVQWRVQSDGVTFGSLPISVSVQPTPGPSKVLSTDILVASTPRLRVREGVNAIGLPYQFADTSLNAILGLQNGADFTAFRWDAETLSYTPVASPARGEGYFLIASQDQGVVDLNGASTPTDAGQGGLLTTLESGWNLIANPYSYPLKLADLLAVAEDDPAVPLTWSELLTNDYVSSALAYYDPTTASYKYTEGSTDVLHPHQAYWIFVKTFKPLRLSWPPVYTVAMADSGRAPGATNIDPANLPWVQTDKNWRLQIAARTNESVDAHNYVGVAQDSKKADQFSLMKPPMAPNANLEVSILDSVKGEATRMSRSFIGRATRKDWTVAVRSTKPGEVTLTWPNLGTLPKNVRFRLVDEAAGVTRDLRATSGYTFTMAEEGTRQFKLTLEIGGLSKPVIGNVLVTPAGKGPSSPVNVTYALSADALVTVRILSTSGKEVFTLSRGRAESAGENTVTWLLRDTANRAVAPGTYQVEIMAETPAGERVRKIVPVNVIR